jgi:hypothetical protein
MNRMLGYELSGEGLIPSGPTTIKAVKPKYTPYRLFSDKVEGIHFRVKKYQMKYKLLKDRFDHKAGTEVYGYLGYTYGLVTDENYATGVAHTAVSLVDNETPFFTIPISDLEPI